MEEFTAESHGVDCSGDHKVLRATLSKIPISNFHPEIDFAHNSSINFTWQVGY